MPDKSKRRRNNKNKRKNKQNSGNKINSADKNVGNSKSEMSDSVTSCEVDEDFDTVDQSVDVHVTEVVVHKNVQLENQIDLDCTQDMNNNCDEIKDSAKTVICVNDPLKVEPEHQNIILEYSDTSDENLTTCDIVKNENSDGVVISEIINQNLILEAVTGLPNECTDNVIVSEVESDVQSDTGPEITGLRNECTDNVIVSELESDVQSDTGPEITGLPNECTDNVIVSEVESGVQSDTGPKITILPNECTDNVIISEVESGVQSDTGTKITSLTNECTDNVIVSEVEFDVQSDIGPEIEIKHKIEPEISLQIPIETITSNKFANEQNNSLTPEEEKSLRNYLQTLNLATNPVNVSDELKKEIEQMVDNEIKLRLRKKGLADDVLQQRFGPPRMLDVIDEESESSISSRRRSYLSDKNSDVDDLDDDVFEDSLNTIHNKEKSKNQKIETYKKCITPECILVGAKIKDPQISEARGDWTLKTLNERTGVDVVYLTDSSSSTSSIHEIIDDTDEGDQTDVSVRMITPTIEITDAEDLLTKSFICPSIKKPIYSDPSFIDSNITDCPSSHEIVVLSTDNIKTDLYVKNIDNYSDHVSENKQSLDINNSNVNPSIDQADFSIEMKVLKCELNDAMNNLLVEVKTDSDINNDKPTDTYTRQDSSSSICSSQCTTKYNPLYSSLNDVSNTEHDDMYDQTQNPHDILSHVNDVFECVTGTTTQENTKPNKLNNYELQTLRELCVKKIASLPFGYKVLEELASVSLRLQNISNAEFLKSSILPTNKVITDKMPYYPLPDVSGIKRVALSTSVVGGIPPPIKPRKSSLKNVKNDNSWTGLPTKSDSVYVCLSPSQKMLIDKTNTVLTKENASEFVDMHTKFIDRRGYNEFYDKKETKKFNEENKDLPYIPFKSQTGSRLMALIRDPSVKINKNHYNSSELRQKQFNLSEQNLNKPQSKSVRNLANVFEVVPPPRRRKLSSSFYESDESSDFTDNSLMSMRSEKKYFHYSTGNLSKEIEDDVSSIQNMHKYVTESLQILDKGKPRRPSLPKDICEQQMEYIRKKEKEVEAEIKRLEEQKSQIVPNYEKTKPKAPMISNSTFSQNTSNSNIFSTQEKSSVAKKPTQNNSNSKLNSLFSSSQEEILRDKMYSEYINQIAQREERKQHKVIKITQTSAHSNTNIKPISKSMPKLDNIDSKVNNPIEKEFIVKARERWYKLGIKDPETEDEREISEFYIEPKVVEHKIKVIDSGEVKDVQRLPNHLQDFVRFTAKKKEATDSPGESENGPASPHVILCAVIVIVFTIGRYFLRFLRSSVN